MRPTTRRFLGPFWFLLVAAGLAGVPRMAAAEQAGADPPPVSAGPAGAGARPWSLAAEPVPAEGGLLALAVGPGGAAAAGDARGLLVRTDGAWRRIPLRGAVRDVAFAPDGALWVASDEGLFRLVGWRLSAHPIAPGDAARAALRLAVSANALAVATQDGVHWSRDGRSFARVEGGFGSGAGAEDDDAPFVNPDDADGAADDEAGEGAPAESAPPAVHGLALAPPAATGAATLWIAAERGLFRAVLASRDGAARVRAERVETPAALRPTLAVTLAGDDVLALGRAALVAGDPAGRGWRAHHPELPPGATPARLVATPDGLWIATDRGVVEAAGPGDSWRRAPEPAGTMPATAVASDGGAVLVAGARGLLVGGAVEGAAGDPEAAVAAPPRPAPALDRFACDPPIGDVQRAALAHLDLTGARTARMWRGVRRRGALPIVTLDGDLADDSRHYRTWDESFVSGETRRVFDRDRDRLRERGVALRLVWDLGDLLYEPEEIDVSTEMRRTIELRDDVLDELNQLYFDRRRARAAAALVEPGTPDAAREELRAEELAAGLDAWTGGWFGARAARSPCPAGDG